MSHHDAWSPQSNQSHLSHSQQQYHPNHQQSPNVYTEMNPVTNSTWPEFQYPEPSPSQSSLSESTLYSPYSQDPNSSYTQLDGNYPAQPSIADILPELGNIDYLSALDTETKQLSLDDPHLFSGLGSVGSVLSENALPSIKGPHQIIINEQPQEFGYRFRYEVEGKAHGGLQGQNTKTGSGKKAKTFPTIEVRGVPMKVEQIEIEARLVPSDDTGKTDEPHPNKLNGKHCTEVGIYHQVIKRSNGSPNFLLEFDGLSILQTKKPDQTKSILGQLMYINNERMQKSIKHEEMPIRSPEELKMLAEKLGKDKYNGVVRLRFQAIFKDESGAYAVAVKHSKPVHDAKQANASELKICRLSETSCSAKGGKEIILLCEKVCKDDIKIKLKKDKWEAEGQFSHTDVHHQFAITFKVPPYKDQNIVDAVVVELKLFRPSTSTYSQAYNFTYYPCPDDDIVGRKRRRPDTGGSFGGPYNPHPQGPFGGNGGLGGGPGGYGAGGMGGGSFMPGGVMNQGGFAGAQPGQFSGGYGQTRAVEEPDSGDHKPMDLSQKGYDTPSTIEFVEGDSIRSTRSSSSKKSQMKTEPKTMTAVKGNEHYDSGVSGIGSIKSPDAMDDDDIVADGAVDISSPRIISESYPSWKDSGLDSVQSMGFNLKGSSQQQAEISKLQNRIAYLEAELQAEKSKSAEYLEYIKNFEIGCLDCMLEFAKTGDPNSFLHFLNNFINIGDEEGQSALHLAVLYNQSQVLDRLLQVLVATGNLCMVNTQNDSGQTPVMLATLYSRVRHITSLLANTADPFTVDRYGNNCFHIAARSKDNACLKVLCKWFSQSSLERCKLDEVNYEGCTPLLVAVQSADTELVKDLIKAGASVDIGHGNSGKTPLHVAAELGDVVTACCLLAENADPNVRAYDGNTPLHLAVSHGHKDIVRFLMKLHSDPEIENYEIDEDSQRGQTALDLAEDNEEIYNMLKVDWTLKSKSLSHYEKISSLSQQTVHNLCTLLDARSSDWTRLAARFDLATTLFNRDEQYTPTKLLLDLLDSQGHSIDELAQNLEAIGRKDCIECLKRSSPRQTSSKPSASGYAPVTLTRPTGTYKTFNQQGLNTKKV